jgi:membrane protease YdiL (CAAX protease family)
MNITASTDLRSAPPARTAGLAERLLADRHSLPLSIALHLVPGALIVVVYLLVTQPLDRAVGLPPFLGWALAMCLALVPFEFGLLLWLGHRRHGRFALREVVHYLDRPLPGGKLAARVVPLIVWFLVVSTALTPLDNLVFRKLFAWVPFDGSGAGLTSYLDGYSHTLMVTSLAVCIPLTGLLLPAVEELYFRGFLMPRLPHQGRWTALISSTLFSVYHLWSPWVVLSRITYLLPAFILVRRNRDLRISVGAHAGTAVLLQTLGTLALMLNVVS